VPVDPEVALIVRPATPPDSDMFPLKVYVPFAPIVMDRVAAPRETLSAKVIVAVELPLPDGTPVVTPPIVKLPPMVKLEYLEPGAKFPATAKVPPLMVRLPAPRLLAPPLTTTVPLFSVNPPT